MGTAARVDPFRSFNFRVEIDGLTVGAFREVSGLAADGTVVEYREGTDLARTPRKLVGLQTFSNIVLKRGYTTNRELWDWYRNILNGLPDRRHGSIILMDEARNDVMRWDFENAWIKKIEGPTFNAAQNEVAIESVELVHEGVAFA
jgi:phage tail-like protein